MLAKIKKGVSIAMAFIVISVQIPTNNYKLFASTNNITTKEIIIDNTTYTISVDSNNTVTVQDPKNKKQCIINYNQKNNQFSEKIIDSENNKIIESVNTVIDNDFNNKLDNQIYTKKNNNDANYEKKVVCIYGQDYWYQKGKKRKYYRIGCEAKYTVKYSGNAERVKVLDNYTNSIDKDNKYYQNVGIECGKAGISYGLAIFIVGLNAFLPEAAIVEALLSAAGICGVGNMAIAAAKCVNYILKMRKEYDNVCKYYKQAKKYAN